MTPKKGLGRGLDALLGDYVEAPAAGVTQMNIYDIDTNSAQPRKSFDEDKLAELAESLKRHGMVQPIILRKSGTRYTIVAGERRFRAARLAGLTQVPVIVKDLDDSQVMEVALIENIQRENLNPIEEAAAIRFLMQQHDLTQEEVSQRLAKSRPAIANSLRLLNLPDELQQALRDGKMQAGHARAILSIPAEEDMLKLGREIAEGGVTVREAEARARAISEKPAKQPAPQAAPVDADLAAAEEALRDRLGTRVAIQGSQRRGKVVIEYFSRQELDGIYELLMNE